MPAIAFDTLKFVKRLRSAGFDEEKAEALSDALKEWYEAGPSDLATKQDIGMLKQDIKELELRLTVEIKLLKWMMGFLLAGVLSLLIKAFFYIKAHPTPCHTHRSWKIHSIKMGRP